MANKLFVLLCRVHKYINRVDNERFFFENISFFYLENDEDQPEIEWEYVQIMSFCIFQDCNLSIFSVIIYHIFII